MKIRDLESKRGQEVKSKRAQEEKIPRRNFPCLTSKRGQEEIIGFGIILILIAIIAIVFIAFSNNDDSDINRDDFETNSFLTALLQTSTSCEKNGNYLIVRDLVYECHVGYNCGGVDSCEVLEENLEGALESSWDIGDNSTVKGYKLQGVANNQEVFNLSEGLETNNYRGAYRDYAKPVGRVEIYLNIYY